MYVPLPVISALDRKVDGIKMNRDTIPATNCNQLRNKNANELYVSK